MSALTLIEGVLDIAANHLNSTGYTNPWAYTRAELAEQIIPVTKGSYLSAIYVVSAVLAVTTCVLALSIVVRWRTGALWVFRLHDAGDRYRYIVPHTTNAWTILAIVMLGLLQGYLWEETFAAKGIIALSLCQWQILPWMACMIVFWVASWSLMTSHILYIKSAGRSSTYPFFMSALFVNTLGIMVPLVHLASVVPLAEVASHYYKTGMQRYIQLDNLLYGEQLIYNGTFDESFVIKHIGLGVTYYNDYQKYYLWFGYSFYLLLGWGLAVQVPLMVIGGMHSRALHQAVKSMRSRRAPGTTVIEDTYRSLLWMCLAFVGSTTVLNANFLFVAHYGKKVNTKPLQLKVATLLAPYIVSTICLPLSFLLLHRALVNRRAVAESSHGNSFSDASGPASKYGTKWGMSTMKRQAGRNANEGFTTVDGFETLGMVTLAGVEAEAAGNRGVTNGRGLNIGVDVETEVQVQREPVVIRFEDGLEAQKDTVDKW